MFIYTKEKCVWTSLSSWHIYKHIYITCIDPWLRRDSLLGFKLKPNDALGCMQHYISCRFRLSVLYYTGIWTPRTRRKGYPPVTPCIGPTSVWARVGAGATAGPKPTYVPVANHLRTYAPPPAAAVPRSLVHRSSRRHSWLH